MSMPVALKILRSSILAKATAKTKASQFQRSSVQSAAGFTLIELLVVIIIIGILAAIAAPSWTGFMNQRRVSAANESVLKALQQAQNQAKKEKISYSVSFRRDTDSLNTLQIAVYPTSSTPSWKDFGQDIGIKRGQVTIGTNLVGENTAGSSIDYGLSNPNTNKITFDYMGTLPITTSNSLGDANPGLIIAVAATSSNAPTQPTGAIRRCVRVATILGSIQNGKLNSSSDACVPL